jgi:hypothetical protein
MTTSSDLDKKTESYSERVALPFIAFAREVQQCNQQAVFSVLAAYIISVR